MNRITRRAALSILAGTGGLVGLGFAIPRLLQAVFDRTSTAPTTSGSGGMMGSTSTADMSSYMDLFDRHTEIHRTVQEVPGGIRTTTESDDPALAARLQAHVSSMYEHLNRGREVSCMSSSLPVLFRHAGGYRRELTITAKGVAVTETSADPQLTQAIRKHAKEVSGFVRDGMPAMMQGMAG
jgi:hypothetical protein